MFKTEYIVKEFSSARSARVKRIVLAPPFLIFILFGLNILLQIPIGYVINRLSFTIGMVLSQVGALFFPAFAVTRLFDLTAREVFPFKRIRLPEAAVTALMMLVLAVLSDYFVFLTEHIVPVTTTIEQKYAALMKVTGFGSYIYKFVFLCLLPAFCEEGFFRGFCQTGLMRYYGNTAGIIIVALMFAVSHMSPAYVHIYFLIGLFLGWIFWSSGSLWIPIICHVVNNWWTFTTHAFGWSLPFGGRMGWGDAAVVSLALIIFLFTIHFWSRDKNSRRQAPNSN